MGQIFQAVDREIPIAANVLLRFDVDKMNLDSDAALYQCIEWFLHLTTRILWSLAKKIFQILQYSKAVCQAIDTISEIDHHQTEAKKVFYTLS